MAWPEPRSRLRSLQQPRRRGPRPARRLSAASGRDAAAEPEGRPVAIQYGSSEARLSQRLCRPGRGRRRNARPGSSPARLSPSGARRRSEEPCRTESGRQLGRLRTGAGERALGLRFHRKRLGRSEMIRQSSRPQRLFAAALIAGASSLLLVQPAYASANIEGLLQNVVDMLTGNTARLLAVLAVVVVGILWMF